jgi:hypothetical protein
LPRRGQGSAVDQQELVAGVSRGAAVAAIDGAPIAVNNRLAELHLLPPFIIKSPPPAPLQLTYPAFIIIVIIIIINPLLGNVPYAHFGRKRQA